MQRKRRKGKYDIISLFSGCGGLDLGFENAGFKVVWANDSAKSVQKTYEQNHPFTEFNGKRIGQIKSENIPSEIIGVIGGPPCQSWSGAGKGLGIEDKRGKLFYEFLRVIKEKQPLFFLAENVEGMMSKKHSSSLETIVKLMEDCNFKGNYKVSIALLDANDYDVPQHRKRIIFVGYHKKLGKTFKFPKPKTTKFVVEDYIRDLQHSAIPARAGNLTNNGNCLFPNHEYVEGGYSYIFMSRNRVLSWDKPSYTLQASGRQACLHPQSPQMEFVKKDVRRFLPGQEHLYRRLSVREYARIQTFPDDFVFCYDSLNTAYKMIGNAVPVNFAKNLAKVIRKDIRKHYSKNKLRKASRRPMELVA